MANTLADEIKAAWNALPAVAQFTIGGSVLGAVGYLFHQSGISRLMPPGMSFRPPYSRYEDRYQREHGGHHQTHHTSHNKHSHGHQHGHGRGHYER